MTQGPRFTAIMPIKSWAAGKSRLHDDPEVRRALAQAVSQDTFGAVAACGSVARILVVTGDTSVAAYATEHGATVVAEPATSADGLAAAIGAGVEWCLEHAVGLPVVVVPADLPALTAQALDAALAEAARHTFAFVADASGLGTTLLAALEAARLEHHYGLDSARLHREAGAHDLTDVDLRVRRDVDTQAELDEAVGLGVGPCTRAALAAWPA